MTQNWTETSQAYYQNIESEARTAVFDTLMDSLTTATGPDDLRYDIDDKLHQMAGDSVIYYADMDKILEYSFNENYGNEQGLMTETYKADEIDEIKRDLAYWAYYADLAEEVNTVLEELEEEQYMPLFDADTMTDTLAETISAHIRSLHKQYTDGEERARIALEFIAWKQARTLATA
jgi:hypothetical protein